MKTIKGIKEKNLFMMTKIRRRQLKNLNHTRNQNRNLKKVISISNNNNSQSKTYPKNNHNKILDNRIINNKNYQQRKIIMKISLKIIKLTKIMT